MYVIVLIRWHKDSLPSLIEAKGKINHHNLFHVAICDEKGVPLKALNISVFRLELTIGFVKE